VSQHVLTAHSRHSDVEQHDRRRVVLETIERLFPGRGFQRRVPKVIQTGAEKPAPFRVVVDDQYFMVPLVEDVFQ
jgi:hypothetical protein